MAHIVKERPETQPKKKKLSKGTRILRNVVIVIVAIALLLGAAVFVLDHFGRSQLTDDGAAMTVIEDAELDNAGRVRYKGQLYEYKKDVTTILLMGVDSRSKEDTEGEFGASNQSDMNVLAVLDPGARQFRRYGEGAACPVLFLRRRRRCQLPPDAGRRLRPVL